MTSPNTINCVVSRELEKRIRTLKCPYCKRSSLWISMMTRKCNRKDCRINYLKLKTSPPTNKLVGIRSKRTL